MPVLTRKRKAELEAGDPEMQEQQLEEAENATKQRSPKRQRCDKPPKRTDPFRPLSPQSPPPRTVMRQGNRVKYSRLKKRTPQPRHPLPILFFTEPEINPARQISARSRSSNDVNLIMATKSLFEHQDKYGPEAMPSYKDLESWLEEHKDEFIQDKARQAQRQPSPARRIQEAPEVADPIAAEADPPAAHNPAARPPERPAPPAANDGIFRRLARYASRSIHGFVNRPDPAPEEVAPQEIPLTLHISQGNLEQPEQPEHTTNIGHLNKPVADPTPVRPIAPTLDPRFFHPNGQLHSVYKYLTADIPLPRQWVRWALANNIMDVPGRGDIRGPGTYVAEDTFDYDALYQAVHRGHFRTGRIEIDYHTDHWPGVEGWRDQRVADLDLDEFRITPEGYRPDGRVIEKSAAPSPEPQPRPYYMSPGESVAGPSDSRAM
ncbi:hypothetical protein F5B19DRAFT_500753 [Rostrohypoxylon terebratum]|nr:hypothetical protein F5B19DRAFT_500753 [Rostrohypoxylon terebratum]